MLENEQIGAIYMKSNLNQVNAHIKRVVIIAGVILIVSVIVTFLLAFLLQRIITHPILKLASTTLNISRQKDYSVRIEQDRGDEIGTLIESFNLMLQEIEKQNNELIKAKTRAEDSSKAKEQFLANMSHEIRTPLNGIDGMTGLLMKTNITDDQKEYLHAVRTSVDALLVIVNDILDISKIEAGKLDLEYIGFNLKESLNNTIRSLDYKAKEKGIRLQHNFDDHISTILIGDPVRLNQIIINLINNAIKFTHEGGVTLNCTLVRKTDTTNTIEFRVTDTGIGIDKDKLEKIFESFSQEDESTTRKYGGTGLGLSISTQLVQLYKGQLKVESEKNKGTSFYFEIELPCGRDTDVPEESVGVVYPVNVKGRKVLLVEDHEINQFLATTILNEWKIEVDLAENGQIAVDKVKSGEIDYDVILMDMQMPVMGGIEATQIIRNELKSTIPIIALTANAVKGDSDKCIEAGMNDYISKPFDPSVLYNKILTLINQ